MTAPTHLRTQIRDAMATTVTGLTTTGTHVYKSRMYPASGANLPCLLVSCATENIERHSLNAGVQQRDIEMRVTGYAKNSTDVDAQLNKIALEVETAIASNETLGGVASRCVLKTIETDIDDSLEKPVGIIALIYLVTTFAAASAPGTPL